eukprot:CAMPEP_0113666462 /NCGR_PEP_ID=MMETSP0038_2-20120614/2886_1 /TAXON_ID=2898 /ORGANISM="Cryptomonas paramecium" /LENGTH=115 /DNA_ID=CAMNT_0000581953 /DNA_START=1 /DNA_END=348 /DNA_ORIENTATION=- /assembly_acc=CAM_ASM_000170
MKFVQAATGAAGRVANMASKRVVSRQGMQMVQKRFSGGVNKHPDLERWNHIRDNVDQIFDLSDPSTLAKAVIFGALIPYGIYKLVESEGFAVNGDSSTGIKWTPNKPSPFSTPKE